MTHLTGLIIIKISYALNEDWTCIPNEKIHSANVLSDTKVEDITQELAVKLD